MRLSDLQSKQIVNITDGANLGKIIDADINERGEILYFVIEKNKMFQRIFSNGNELVIKFSEIEKIGTDVILVNNKEH